MNKVKANSLYINLNIFLHKPLRIEAPSSIARHTKIPACTSGDLSDTALQGLYYLEI
jgi:hypothetical protein